MGHYRNASSYFMIRISAVLNWLSFKFDSINALLYQLFSFCGLVAVYKSFLFFYPKEKWKLLLGVFLTPSVIFWLSGYHKEGISIFAVGLCLYAFVKNRFITKDSSIIFLAILSLAILGVVRNYLALLLCMALAAFYISTRVKIKSYASYFITYSLGFLFINVVAFFSDRFSYLNKIYEKYYFFKNYAKGNSDISIPDFRPELLSFLSNIPKATYNALCRPHFFDVENTHLFFRGLAAIENSAILILIALALFMRKTKKQHNFNFLHFNLFLSISFIILIGLVISNLGALVRYKSVIYPLFITSLLICVDFKILFKKK